MNLAKRFKSSYNRIKRNLIQVYRIVTSIAKFRLEFFTSVWEVILLVIAIITFLINWWGRLNNLTIELLSELLSVALVDKFMQWIAVSSVALFLLAVMKTLIVLYKLKHEAKKFEQMALVSIPANKNLLFLNDKYTVTPNEYVIRELDREIIVYSKTINTFLQNYPQSCWDEKRDFSRRKIIREYIQENEWFLKTYYTYLSIKNVKQGKALMFNEEKLCLSDDLMITNGKLNVHFHKGSYFESLLTNETFRRYIYTDERRHSFFAHESVLDELKAKGEIKGIRDSNFSNHIGCSCLGITTDNKLLLWKQSSKVLQGSGKLVSTGSGSVDWGDIKAAKSVYRAVKRGMRREIIEETMDRLNEQGAVKNHELNELTGDVQFVGYYRWYDRGGKPEFLGLCRVFFDSRDPRIVGNISETHGTPEVLDVSDINAFIKVMDEIANRESDRAYLSLRTNALCAGEWAKENPEAATKFLGLGSSEDQLQN